jgi:hypothetical protein
VSVARSILASAALLSVSLFLGLLLNGRFELTPFGSYLLRIDKLTGEIVRCYIPDRVTCRSN